jgi:hypothetical protein
MGARWNSCLCTSRGLRAMEQVQGTPPSPLDLSPHSQRVLWTAPTRRRGSRVLWGLKPAALIFSWGRVITGWCSCWTGVNKLKTVRGEWEIRRFWNFFFQGGAFQVISFQDGSCYTLYRKSHNPVTSIFVNTSPSYFDPKSYILTCCIQHLVAKTDNSENIHT